MQVDCESLERVRNRRSAAWLRGPEADAAAAEPSAQRGGDGGGGRGADRGGGGVPDLPERDGGGGAADSVHQLQEPPTQTLHGRLDRRVSVSGTEQNSSGII